MGIGVPPVKTLGEHVSVSTKSLMNNASRSRGAIHIQSPQTGEAGGGGGAAFPTVG